MTDSSQPIAGWYPDPENAAAERWWDGTAWSDHRRPSTVAPVPPAAPAVSVPAPAVDATASPYVTPTPAQPAYGQYAPTNPAAYNPYGAPAYTPAAPTNSLAVVGLVLALGGLVVSFGGLTSLAGGIVSTVALVRAHRMRAQGLAGHRWGMALAGTICGYAIFVLVVVALIAFIAYAAAHPGTDAFSGTSFS